MIKTVTDGNGTTHFFDVVDKMIVIGKAMVFVPARSLVEAVPMLVYYHGHNSQDSIEGYIGEWNSCDFRPLLGAKKSRVGRALGWHEVKVRNAHDRFGPDDPDRLGNGYRHFRRPGRASPATPPPPQSLIIAGFSGGGAALNARGGSNSAYLGRLSEAWAFDCLYSEEGQRQTWVNWAKANGSKRLRLRVTTMETSGSPRRENKIIRATPLPNIDAADPVGVGHEDCPGTFIPQWI